MSRRFAALFAFLAGPAGASPFTLAAYTALALERSPEVRSAREAYEAADAAYKGSVAAMALPTLSFTGLAYPYGRNPLAVDRFERWRLAEREARYETSLNWNLFNGFKDWEKANAAELARSSAEETLRAARQDRAFAAIQAFHELDAKTELLAVARQNLSAQATQYEQSLDLYKHGMRSLADLLKSETDWRSSQLRLVSAEAERKRTLTSFNALLDRGGLEEAELAGGLQAGATELPPLSEDVARAVSARPEARRARKDVERAAAAARQAAEDALPSLRADAAWTKTRAARLPGASSPSPNPSYQIGLTLSLPIGFNGASQVYALARARADRRAAEAAAASAERVARSEVYAAFINLERAARSYSLALLKEEIAAKALELVGRQYRQGAADAIRMNQAQNDYLSARVERALALHDIFIDRARYKRAVGDQLW